MAFYSHRNINNNNNKKLKVSIIGCGRLGTHLVKALLEFTPLTADDVTISTRRGPESLVDADIKVREVKCFKENKLVVAPDTDVVFFMFPPGELPKVAKDIKGLLHEGCLVYSILAGANERRIAELCDHELIFKPEYILRVEKYLDEADWNYSCGVTGFLAMNEFKELTCPLASMEEMSLRAVGTTRSLLRTVFLQSLNVYERHSVKISSTEEKFELCNRLLFGDRVGFSAEHFHQGTVTEGNGEYYAMNEISFDLVDDSTDFCRHFEKHYKTVLDRFVDWTDCYRL